MGPLLIVGDAMAGIERGRSDVDVIFARSLYGGVGLRRAPALGMSDGLNLVAFSESCTTLGSTMAKRAGVTSKVSLSVNRDDLAMLKERAKRLYGGNVSAVFAELIATIRRQEAWGRAVAWYGKPLVVTDDERDDIDRELLGDVAPRRKRRTSK